MSPPETEALPRSSATKPVSRRPPANVTEAQLVSHFQPIVSLRTGRCWGVEALTRAGSTFPRDFFDRAVSAGGMADVEERSVARAAQALASQVGSLEGVFSVNWDARVVRSLADDPQRIRRAIEASGLAVEGLCVELSCRAAHEPETLLRAVRALREAGVLIALDDFGATHAPLDLIARLAPDVVKLDPAMTTGASTSDSQREICRAVVELCRHLGTVVVAEAIEEESDLVELAMLGVDLFQGYLVARPQADAATALHKARLSVERCRPMLRTCAERELRARRQQRTQHEHVLVTVAARLAHANLGDIDQVCRTLVDACGDVEALYVLDHRGVQLTATVMRRGANRPGFTPAVPGTDLGLKEYFLEVAQGTATYASPPYVSMASGRVCVTHSRRLRLSDGSVVIVCCDMPSDPRRLPG